ncbi:hypothetical protein BURPS668_0278 [Burkholderia pseudomallei 668]|nr:hypothetical protein BURPS668_0278 [Burkholderia pseudomallei 668]
MPRPWARRRFRAARRALPYPALRLPPARIPSAGRFCSPLVSAIPASYTRA